MLHSTVSAARLSPHLESLGSKAVLTTYCRSDIGALADRAGRWGVIICPGGAYRMIAPTEGEGMALQFLAAGVQAFVLSYSTLPDAQYPLQLLELASAVAWVKEHRGEFNVDRVAVCGFSAGGHLAGCLCNLWEDEVLDVLGLDRPLLRPDAAILSYPVISRTQGGCAGLFDQLGAPEQTSLERSVTPGNPPTFLWCTGSDERVDCSHSLLYANALKQANVPFALHLFPNGPHAMSTATEQSAFAADYVSGHVGRWFDLCIGWLNTEV